MIDWTLAWNREKASLAVWLDNLERIVRATDGANKHNHTISEIEICLGSEARRLATVFCAIAEDPLFAPDSRSQFVRIGADLVDRATFTSAFQAELFGVRLAHCAGVIETAANSTDAPRRCRVERALEHLKRSLVVDEDLRRRWRQASREEECERLGAVHLLLHGVFAFKVNGAGGRTDLVLSGELSITPAVRGSDALVLTEWKVVRDGDNVSEKAGQAIGQAERYAAGVLQGVEVSSARYVILVSVSELAGVPDDSVSGSVVYRHYDYDSEEPLVHDMVKSCLGDC